MNYIKDWNILLTYLIEINKNDLFHSDFLITYIIKLLFVVAIPLPPWPNQFTVCPVSLSTVVLNSRDQPENILLPKRIHLDKQCYKNQNTKNLPQCYNYSSNNAISSFKQAKCCH